MKIQENNQSMTEFQLEKEQEAKVRENKEFLEHLKARNCRENIKRYREEMEYYKSLMNPYNVTMSSANIEQKIEKIIKREESNPDV